MCAWQRRAASYGLLMVLVALPFAGAAPEPAGDVVALVERGRLAINEKKYDRAIHDFTDALRLNSEYAPAYAWRAQARRHRGELDQAIADCNEALKRNPDLLLALVERADASRLKGFYARAIADCDTALKLNPKASGAYGIRGGVRLRQHDYDGAVADLTEALRLAPRYVSAYVDRGEAYIAVGKYNAAVADLSEAVRLDPTYAYPYACRGDAYRLKGDYDRAIADCNEALKRAPKSARAYATRGGAQLGKRHHEEAVLDFTEALRLDPRYVFALTYRGESYRLQGKLDDALKDLTDAITINPRYAAAYQFRSRVYQARGDNERASADWDRAMQLNPRLPHPFVALETGGHTARVMQVLFTPDGKELISVAEDKTIRRWNVQTGEALDVIRPPINQGKEGMLYTAALSPEGKMLATAGYGRAADHNGTIYLINLVKRRMERVLTGHTRPILSLTYSPDGKHLASSSFDHSARVWDVAEGKCAQILQGHEKAIYSVAFSPDGRRLATASFDRTARIWSLATGKSEVVLTGHTAEVRCIAWSPDGRTIATSGYDASIRLWNLDGTAREGFDKLSGNTVFLTFSPDGRQLLFTTRAAAGRSSDCSVLDLATGEQQVRFRRHDNTVMSGAISPDGRLVATADGNDDAIYIWRISDGSVVSHLVGRGKRPWSAGWGLDGRTIAWGNSRRFRSLNDLGPVERAWNLSELELCPRGNQPLRRAQTSHGSWALEKTGRSTVAVKRSGETVAELKLSDPYERVQCFTILPDDRAVVGADFGLYLFNTRTGKHLRTFWGHTGAVWAVAPSPDNRYLLSASSDQTVRVWSPDRSWPLLTLFVAGTEWVAWTPEGYYAASPGGERLMGWHLNNGPDQLASFYPTVQFRKSLYRPDVIRRLLDAGNVPQALAQADKGNGKKSQYTQASQVLPPRVVITAPTRQSGPLSQAHVEVRARASSVGDYPVTSLRLLLNGRPYRGEAGLRRLASPQLGDTEGSFDVQLMPGINRLCVQASSAVSVGMSEEVILDYRPPGQHRPRSDLYVLAIGINAYPGASKLEYAVSDAQAMAKLLQGQQGRGLYRQVHIRTLTDQHAGRQDIVDGLRWLQEKVRPIDVALVFYAGHGVRDANGRFYLLPSDMDQRDLARKGVSEDELKEALAELPGKVLLLLDACHAGKVGEFELARPRKRGVGSATDDLLRLLSADDYGVVVMCAAQGRQESGESAELGHGYFTQALLEGLGGKADYNKDGMVTLTELDNYVAERVLELSQGLQTACTAKSTRTGAFPIVRP